MGGAREGTNFFPLMVDYEAKFYAAGKIKGSRFIKREGRPSENAILNARLIDRPIRPLFPKGMTNDVQVICTVLSADLEVEPGAIALIAASAALSISGMPFDGPVGAVRVGYIEENGEWKLIINPTYQQLEEGKLDLVVAGTKEALTMIEAASNEVSEEVMLQAFELAQVEIKKICELQERFKEAYKKENDKEVIIVKDNEEAVNAVKESLTKETLDKVKGVKKKEISKKLKEIEEQLLAKYEEQIESAVITKSDLKQAILHAAEQNMRENILTII